jgi:hypothetical protein
MPIISPINSDEEEEVQKKKKKDEIENYDPNTPVCGNQADFNKAFSVALRKYFDDKYNNMSIWALFSLIIWLIFFIWAVVLALRVEVGTERTEHLFFAILFSPLYVVAHYLSAIVSEAKSSSSRKSAVFGGPNGCACSG